MKLIFISIWLLIHGWFCDICVKLCKKRTEASIKKNKPLTGKGLIFISNFTSRQHLVWNCIEKKAIHLFLERNF